MRIDFGEQQNEQEQLSIWAPRDVVRCLNPPKSFALVLLAAICLFGWQVEIASAQLNVRRMFRKKVDAQEDQTYELGDQNGPWLILCASFRGEDALRQANDLVFELRKVHRLDAYIYRKQFDFSEQMQGIAYSPDKASVVQTDRGLEPQRMATKALSDEVFEEIAVVVGDFPELDDKRTQRALRTIKYLQPRSLTITPNEETSQSFGQLRERVRQIAAEQTADSRQNSSRQQRDDDVQLPDWDKMGPMRLAFVIPNPLLPEDYFQQQKLDRSIINVNQGLTYSLLKNRKPYTVRVATFRGKSTFKTQNQGSFNINATAANSEPSKQLAIAAAKAHRLTNELRELGVEAYEFHDRFESYVCVGGFDWVSDPSQVVNGREQMNPEMAEVIQSYAAEVTNFNDIRNAAQPKSLPELRGLGITFDVQPLPVRVPRAR